MTMRQRRRAHNYSPAMQQASRRHAIWRSCRAAFNALFPKG